jgi:hypothetical protein
MAQLRVGGDAGKKAPAAAAAPQKMSTPKPAPIYGGCKCARDTFAHRKVYVIWLSATFAFGAPFCALFAPLLRVIHRLFLSHFSVQ